MVFLFHPIGEYFSLLVSNSDWFGAQSAVSNYGSPSYSWEYARSEIEFVFKAQSGDIVPIEVKSGKHTRAKSLDVYVQRYLPTKIVKLIGSTGSLESPEALVLPLYYASKIEDLIGE